MNTPAPMTTEEWIAQGNLPTVLPMGYTAFKDGVLPRAKGCYRSEAMRMEQEKKTAEKNEQIRLANQAKANARMTAQQLRQAKISALRADQMTTLSEFIERAGYGDKAKLLRLANLTPKTFSNALRGNGHLAEKRWVEIKSIILKFEYSKKLSDKELKVVKKKEPNVRESKKRVLTPDGIRRKQIITAKKEAIAKGETTFQAPCATHGMTLYLVRKDRAARCYECDVESTRARRRMHDDAIKQDRRERKQFNQARMLEALAKGERTFTGLCVNCGHTKFSITNANKTYKCVTCRKAADQKYKQKIEGKA